MGETEEVVFLDGILPVPRIQMPGWPGWPRKPIRQVPGKASTYQFNALNNQAFFYLTVI